MWGLVWGGVARAHFFLLKPTARALHATNHAIDYAFSAA
jgi:hypothetical protein